MMVVKEIVEGLPKIVTWLVQEWELVLEVEAQNS